MTPENWVRVKEVFHAALERAPAERASFVARACSGDAELAGEVTSLLARHRDDGFLDESPLPAGSIESLEASLGATDGRVVPVMAAADLGLKSCPACSSCYGDGRFSCPEDGESLVAELTGPPLIDSKYLIDHRLGHGGMGVVYRARHELVDRLFALKLIRPEASSNTEFLARFTIEAKALGRLKHSGIVEVTDSGVDPRDGGLPYLVMEYLEGVSLHEHARRTGALPVDEALDILDSVATALDFAHEKGVLHRDLKEANVFLCPLPSGPPATKILDFGLARLLSAVPDPLSPSAPIAAKVATPRRALVTAEGPSPTMSLGRLIERPLDATPSPREGRLTQPGQVGGTLEYAAPEVLRAEEATVSSDLYSLAVMAYRLLVGRLPFQGTAVEVIQGHLKGTPPQPSSACPSLPPEMDGPLLRGLAKDASSRPRRAVDLVESLRAAAGQARRRVFRAREVPRRLLWAAVGGGVLAALVLAVSGTGPLHKLELSTIDARFALQPVHPPDPRLVLVFLDDASLAADESPLPQKGDEFGRRLTALFEAGARSVALDILAPLAWGRTEGFANLVLQHADRLTLAAAVGSSSDALGPESVAGLTAAALGPERVMSLFGLVNIEEDPDGIVRRSRLYFFDRDGVRRPTLATRAAVTLAGPAVLERQTPSSLWIDYAVDWQRIPRVSWKDLEERLRSEPQLFRDKLVLVGADFNGSGDLDHRIPTRSTAPDVVPGVVLHALIAHSILEQGVRYRESVGSLTALVLWLALSLVLAVPMLFARLLRLAPWFAVAVALHVAFAIVAFRWGLIVPVVAPLMGAALALGSGLALRAFLPRHPGW